MSNWWEDDDYSEERRASFEFVVQAFSAMAPSARRDWSRAPCPKCLFDSGKQDSKSSLGYNWETGGFSCFKCGMRGRLPLHYRERLDDVDDVVRAPAQQQEAGEQKPVAPAAGYVPLYDEPGLSFSGLDWARDYLAGRPKKNPGVLKPEHLRAAGVGAACYGRLAGRVIVPIPDYSNPTGPWRGWVSREALGRPTDRPYLYSKGMIREGLLYNSPALQVATDAPCFVVEGTLDALALWPGSVAVLGKPLQSQILMMARARRPIAVCLDGDAWEEGQALTWTLQMLGAKAVNIRLEPGIDPDELGLEELTRRAWRLF